MKKKTNDGTSVNSPLLRRPIQRMFFVFLLPTFIAFCIGFVYPFLQGMYLSFCSFTTISSAKFIGIGNYIKALEDATFTHAFWFTALFAVISVVLINVLAFLVAYLLTLKIKGANLFRTAFFMPNLIGGIVLGYIWSMIFNGILSKYQTSILMETKYGFWGLMILMLWQRVPEELIEAARIDGANRWQTLIHVTIPNVMSSITICMFLSLTNGFKLFDQNLALTAGQPFIFQDDGSQIKTTEMLALNIYNTFYGQSSAARGTGQAKAVIFFVLVALISVIQLRATRSKEVQQ